MKIITRNGKFIVVPDWAEFDTRAEALDYLLTHQIINEMIILISSDHLKQELSNIDFESDRVRSVNFKLDLMTLETDKMHIPIECHTISNTEVHYPQEKRRWDWVYRLVSKMEEQPITINITDSNLQISVNY